MQEELSLKQFKLRYFPPTTVPPNSVLKANMGWNGWFHPTKLKAQVPVSLASPPLTLRLDYGWHGRQSLNEKGTGGQLSKHKLRGPLREFQWGCREVEVKQFPKNDLAGSLKKRSLLQLEPG